MKRIFYLILLLCLVTSCKKSLTNAVRDGGYPDIYPDYIDVTIPCNIAPLNFTSRTPVDEIDVVIKGEKSTLHLQRGNYIDIPIKDWRLLMKENVGKDIRLTVSFYNRKSWTTYKTFAIHISRDSIDNGLVYRMITPEVDDSIFGRIGVYQRDLRTFKQKTIIVNSLAPGCFIDSYGFCRNNPDYTNIIVDSKHSAAIFNSKIFPNEKFFDTKTPRTVSTCRNPYWHPEGRYVAYSTSLSQQVFHSVRNQHVDVIDTLSDVVVYDTKENRLLLQPLLMTKALETSPAFSADGKKLYFCTTLKRPMGQYKQIQYSLCSIDFNSKNGTFGNKVDTIVSNRWIRKSISFPRPSYDGRFILFSTCDFGISTDWNSQSDLYLYNLKTKQCIPVRGVNTNMSQGYHNWSSNSRWFVYTCNKDDGLFSRLYFTLIDKDGKATKPFMLPQRNPNDNVYSLYSYTLPEFVVKPVVFNIKRTSVKLMTDNRRKFN